METENAVLFFQNPVILMAIVVLAMFALFGLVDRLPKKSAGKAPLVRTVETSKVDEGEEEQEDAGSPFGKVVYYSATRNVLATSEVYGDRPDWDFDEDGESMLTFEVTAEGEEREITLGAIEYATFTSHEPDEDCDGDEEWMVVVVDGAGEVVLREVVLNDEMPDTSDNYILAWTRNKRTFNIYCGSGLGICVVRSASSAASTLQTPTSV